MTGRNDPCPCGSGKKYKKCCLPKEQAARLLNPKAAEKLEPEKSAPSQPIEPTVNFPAVVDEMDESPEIDPLIERTNDFWEAFIDAPYEAQWSSVDNMLNEAPELCDGEMVFEITNTLFSKAVQAGEETRFKQLLSRLQEAAPEAYAQELAYILDYYIRIALLEEDDAALEQYFYQFSPLAGDKLDEYYRIVSALAYHGKLAILHAGMRQARPFVAEGGGLVEWAYAEYTEKLADIELLHLLERNPDLAVDDATLQQRFAEYEMEPKPEVFSLHLDYRSGRRKPEWTPADFLYSGRSKNGPGRVNFNMLLAAFTHYTNAVEGIPLTKAELAREELSRYLGLRHEGELGNTRSGRSRGRRKQRKNKQDTDMILLVPDPKTLDRYLGQAMGFMSFRFYEASALFELIPAWLRFLTLYNLLAYEEMQKVLQKLSYLKGSLIKIMNSQLTDTAVGENLANWPYETRNNG